MVSADITRCKLHLAAVRFTTPPTPSHAFFPWLVAKKCHSARMPKSVEMEAQIQKLFSILVLSSTSITEVINLGNSVMS